jgi:uncharacterized protein (TIGR02466 family)
MNNITHVGGIPIGIFQWNDFNLYQTDLVSLCLSLEKPNIVESNIASSAKSNLWESDFSFLSNSKLTPLATWINQTTTQFVNQINQSNYRIAITESWAHVTRNQGSHDPHRHPNSTWSGIFYVDADNTANAYNTWWNLATMPREPGLEFYSEQFTINFIPGQLVIFPGTMLHYAKPYSGSQRIIIAFNSICV